MVKMIADLGLSQVFYNIFFYSGFVGLFIFNLITCKYYRIKKWQATVFTVCTRTGCGSSRNGVVCNCKETSNE